MMYRFAVPQRDNSRRRETIKMLLEEPLQGSTLPQFWRKPLDLDQQKIPRGIVHINEERCKDCSFCIEFCPRDVLEKSDRFNKKGYNVVRVAAGRKEFCVACRHCEDICPEFALWIEEVKM